MRACRAIDHDPANASVLDVGCGCGGDVRELSQLHYDPEKIIGIDLLPDRIRAAEKLWPQTRFILGDASRMEFADDSFDLVFELTMFATLPDDVLSAAIAREMVRVCRPGGYLMLVDWRTPKPRDPDYKALTRRRLADLFAVSRRTELLRVCRGALVPPVGRSLSTWLPSVYFLVAAVFPFLVGQVTYVLQKKAETPGVADMLKRLFDIVICAFGLLLFSPLLLLIALWVKLDSPGPVFYRGRRAGRNGVPFGIFKFRSMVVNADKIGGPSTSGDDPRVTRSGRFVRKCKLDEVSQLINVFLGDMSLVGPRPEVVDKAEKFDAEARKTLAVRPASPIGPRSGTPTKAPCWPAPPIPTPPTKKSSSPRN